MLKRFMLALCPAVIVGCGTIRTPAPTTPLVPVVAVLPADQLNDVPFTERLPAPAAEPAASTAPTATIDPTGPLTLMAVEELACTFNPTLVQARAQVDGTLGKALQAGLWPNPVLGYEGEKIGIEGTAGEFQGGFVRQEFVTARKRRVSREKYLARAGRPSSSHSPSNTGWSTTSADNTGVWPPPTGW